MDTKFSQNFFFCVYWHSHSSFLFNFENVWGAWVAQLVERPTLIHVMISRSMGLSPASGSVLTPQSLEPALDSVSHTLSVPLLFMPSLSLSLSLSISLPLSLCQKYINIKNILKNIFILFTLNLFMYFFSIYFFKFLFKFQLVNRQCNVSFRYQM